ncbi:MAG: STT3 domain-containing protein, partial [Candidatus Omnitrophica bacterium]|nr:STT3 domain-containing protein [Candidatus Omnitrophota bacterium]
MKLPYQKRIFTPQNISFLLLFFCLSISIYVRLAPAYFPQAKAQAQRIITHRMQLKTAAAMEQKYPGYNERAKEKIVEDIIKEEQKKKEFKGLVRQEYRKLIRPYQDKDGHTYLLELDPYQWMRNTENVVRFGHPGTEKKENKIYDTYMLAPKGLEVVPIQFLFFCSAFFYKIYSFFFQHTPLVHFLFYLPLVYVSIFLTLLYFFSRRFFSRWGAFFTTLFVGLSEIFVLRSCVGWFDYDTLSMTMPLLIVWCLSLAFTSKGNWKRLIFYALCASFFQGLYTFTWIGWWFIFLIVIAAVVFITLNNYLIAQPRERVNRESILNIAGILIFFAGSIFFCFLISGGNLIKDFFTLLKDNLYLGDSASKSIWPNVSYTISELQAASIRTISNSLYNKSIAVLSVASLVWIYFKERRGENKFVIYSMVFWTVFMTYASFKAVRFILYLAIPLGFFLGWAIHEMGSLIRRKFSYNRKIRLFCVAAFAFLLSYLITVMITTGIKKSRTIYPMLNNEWANTLSYLKDNTPQDAILNSWWDFGDWFKALAHRRVIFDGQSQKGFLAYWMARAMLSTDEQESIRILKMLNNASDTTFSVLSRYVRDPFLAERLLERLLFLDREGGEKILKQYKVPPSAIVVILDDLHKRPGAAYFIVDKSMLVKMGSISFLGNWDFKRVFAAHNINSPEAEVRKGLEDIFSL